MKGTDWTETDWTEVVFYVSIAVLFLWALFKALGVIRPPVWIDLIPFFSIAFAAGAFYQKIARLAEDMALVLSKVEHIDKRVTALESEKR